MLTDMINIIIVHQTRDNQVEYKFSKLKISARKEEELW